MVKKQGHFIALLIISRIKFSQSKEVIIKAYPPEQSRDFLYSCHFNPRVDVLSRCLAAMEGTKSACGTASGMRLCSLRKNSFVHIDAQEIF
jgi:cystathionine beta-lyase/cystathionine gamma-synthase